MMIAKIIQCQLASEADKKGFDLAQQAWNGIAECEGLVFQCGGWLSQTQAYILAVWQDSNAYQVFMDEYHDDIFIRSEQCKFYQTCQVELFKLVYAMPDELFEQEKTGLLKSGFMRLADCIVAHDGKQTFWDDQINVWQPGMLSAKGMKGGMVLESMSQPERLLVCSFWQTQVCHQQYTQAVFPQLRSQVRLENYIDNLSGLQLSLEPQWWVGK